MPEWRIVPYDHARHAGFLFGGLRASLARCWPWSMMPPADIAGGVKWSLAAPGTTALVAVLPDDPDTYLGVVVARPPSEIVWAYVPYAYRRMGIASALAVGAGVVATAPIAVRYWTRAAERIAVEHGRSLYFRVTEGGTDERRAA